MAGVRDNGAEGNAELLEPTRHVAHRAWSRVANYRQRSAADHRPVRRTKEGACQQDYQQRRRGSGAVRQNSGFDFQSASLISASYSSADMDRFA